MEKDDKDLSNVSDEDFGNLDSSSESSDEDIDDDDSSSNDSDDSIDEGSKKKKKKNQKKPAKKPKKAPKVRIIMNVSDTQYDVVKYVGKKVFGWKLSYDKESTDWDMFWTDWAVEPETLARMQTFQKINHFPGMYSLARKNHLGRNLMRMRKNFPDKYKFFPQTFLLPTDYAEFRNQFTKGTTKTFIAKPEASCQGRGIFLTRSPDSIQPGEHFVVQRYLQKPFLIDGLKFDMRIYVLLAGCDPLKVFLYDDGLGRFATETYVAPTGDNLDNVCMHLTNYAINKDNPNFVFNESSSADDVGHKRSLKAVMRTLKEMGHDVDTLWKEIKKIIIKTFCSVQPILAHSYRSCHPDEPYNNMCFELLGFDVMIDHKLRPWLIEVNHTPSFTTDTPLDKSIKKSAIRDALRIMNISVDNKIKAKNKKRIELQQRVLTGKKIKLTPEEKKEAFEKAQQERDAWESKNCGRYEKIYPIDDPSQCDEDYEEYMKFANKWWEEWTGLSIKRNAKRVVDPNKPPPMVFGNGPPVVLPPKVQKQKTIAVNPKPGSGQNSRSYQPDTVQANPEVESKPDKIAAEPNEDAYVPDRSFDEENKNFMAHVAAITETEAVDVIAEDHEEGITERNVKKYVPIRSYNLILSSKADDKQAEIDGNFKLANNMSPSMNALTSSPETKITTKNSSFRIKTMSGVKESPHKSVSEQNINKSEEQRFSVLQKFSNFLNAERVEDLQIAVGAIPTGKGEINTRKIPMKSSNGLSQIWTGPGSLAAMYAHEVERGPRDAGNVLFNKLSARNQHHVNHGKKLVSPSHQYVKSPGNFVAPRLFELNLNGNSKEDAGMKSPVNNVPIGLSSHGSAGSLKGAKVVLGQREQNPHWNPFYDPQAAIQRYYNYLNHIKR